MRTTDTHIYFWGSFLSNWIPSDLYLMHDNQLFTNSEQLFMYFKAAYFSDWETAKEIVEKGQIPKIAKDLGRKIKGYNEEEWATVREEMMYKAIMIKFKSSEELKQKLIDTYPKILVEGTPMDPVWGVMIKWDDDRILDEKNWRGQNLLGKVLMRVRNNLINTI